MGLTIKGTKRTKSAFVLVVLALVLVLEPGCGGGGMSSTASGGSTASATATISKSVVGPFKLAMSTSFQPAEWDYTLFQDFSGLTTPLGNLQSQHIRLQGVSQGVPQTTASTWDFSILDAITQPVLSVGDHSPEFQIAVAPAFMYDSNHNFLDPTYQQFAAYTQDLVSYYNAGGFPAPDGTHVSPSYPAYPITWWGIYNEPNINNLDAAQYTQLYNTVVPAMQAIGPGLKFAAVELSDGYNNWEQTFLPPFVSGVTAQVDVLATHFYSSCNQKDSDEQVLSTVPGFASGVQYIYSQLKTNPALTNVPVWITENNVNADFAVGNGISNCNGTTFVDDLRGSSAFFAAWRPYVFSQLGKAGAEALYHWDFGADPQYGEVNAGTGQLQLSYWVDYWLERMFPSSGGGNLLQYSNSDDTDLEVLPVANSDGSVVIMVANHAVNSPSDDNGPGAPRSVLVDVSALGSFTSGSLLTIDANTKVADGPSASSVAPAAQTTVSFDGYGVAFLTLKP